MLLRRMMQHVKQQNWLAVALDFAIVVIGVGVALIAQQWLSDRQQQANLVKAEYVLSNDLFNIIYNAEERRSLAECRRQRTHELVTLLQQPSEDWAATTQAMDNWYGTVFNPVITTATRSWASNFWDAELQRGTFNLMDNKRRERLGSLLQYARITEARGERVYDLETRLNVLGLTLALSTSDRRYYLELLTQHDGAASLMDIAVPQLLDAIKVVGVDRSHPNWTNLRDGLIEFNSKGPARWGECFLPVVSDLLDIGAAEETTR